MWSPLNPPVKESWLCPWPCTYWDGKKLARAQVNLSTPALHFCEYFYYKCTGVNDLKWKESDHIFVYDHKICPLTCQSETLAVHLHTATCCSGV